MRAISVTPDLVLDFNLDLETFERMIDDDDDRLFDTTTCAVDPDFDQPQELHQELHQEALSCLHSLSSQA